MLLDIPALIISLAPRDWVKESINLQGEKLKASSSAHLTMAIDRKLLQLSQHFRWFLWSVAAYCHVSLSREAQRSEFERMTHSTAESSCNDTEELPRDISKWFAGFTYKNVFFLLAYSSSEIGHLIKNELSAVKKIILSFEH